MRLQHRLAGWGDGGEGICRMQDEGEGKIEGEKGWGENGGEDRGDRGGLRGDV